MQAKSQLFFVAIIFHFTVFFVRKVLLGQSRKLVLV